MKLLIVIFQLSPDRKEFPNFKAYRMKTKKVNGNRPPAYLIVTNEEGL